MNAADVLAIAGVAGWFAWSSWSGRRGAAAARDADRQAEQDRVDAELAADSARLRARAAFEAERIRWGQILKTHAGRCPDCGAGAVLKVYETSNIEMHCPACGLRREV